jgi:simple sugar transport system ATP-binding protein
VDRLKEIQLRSPRHRDFHALSGVSFDLPAGRALGLIGENGAGKSTLMRIVAGELPQDSGDVAIDRGRVGMVHQHFALVSQFTIAENLALVRDRAFRFVSSKSLEADAEETIRTTGIELRDVSRRAADLSVGERAKLELIKAIAPGPEILVLDEPTSVLTPIEFDELFSVIRRLAAAGTAIVFITHKIPEVMEVAERLVVMRRGRVVADTQAKGMTAGEIATAMVGKPGENGAAQTLSSVREGELVSATPPVHAGEIVAVVGVAGNGQRELADSVRISDSAFIPEDRRDALVGEMTIAENIALAARRWRPREAMEHAQKMILEYGIRARSPLQPARELSGGNQQKVVLARELGRNPRLIIASEPTRGLDVEATRFVQDKLRSAAQNGAAILLITSDLDEAFALADGIHVIYRGELSQRMTRDEAKGRVANLMAGIA